MLPFLSNMKGRRSLSGRLRGIGREGFVTLRLRLKSYDEINASLHRSRNEHAR